MRHIEVLHLIIEDPFKNQSCLPLCTTNGGTSIVFQNFASIPCSHHAGNSKLPADDGRMASPSSAVGHNARGNLHDGFPVRVCHLGNQYLALLKLLYLSRTGDDIDGPSANLFTDTLPLDQNPSLLF